MIKIRLCYYYLYLQKNLMFTNFFNIKINFKNFSMFLKIENFILYLNTKIIELHFYLILIVCSTMINWKL